MALENSTGGLSGIRINPALDSGRSTSSPEASVADGVEFKRALDQVAATQPSREINQGALKAALNPGALTNTSGATALKFSNHAIDRMRSRGIGFQPDEMQKIASAVEKAAAKGAKDTLVLSGDNALIVSVKNKTVVTVMDRAAMKENVFTNIDSTVVL